MKLHISLFLCASFIAAAAEYRTPAGTQPARRTEDGQGTILPGGRMLSPLGRQFLAGPGPFGLAVSPAGTRIVSANGGPDRFSLTILDRDNGQWTSRQVATIKRERDEKPDEDDWTSTFMGLAFDGEDLIYASEGESGRVRAIDAATGRKLHRFDLNGNGYHDSYSADLAFDRDRGLLYVVDQANFRLAIFDTRKRAYVASVRTGRLPFAVTLSPDSRRAYVTNLGMFAYKVIPGADPKRIKETGLPFPAFGFPSKEAQNGVERTTEAGKVQVPGLGDPNLPESNSLCVIDVSDPKAAKVDRFIRTGLPFGRRSNGGSSPAGVLATATRIYVTNSTNDSIAVIDAATLKVLREVPIRIPGLEPYRGVLPIGLAYDSQRHQLLVAEAGINAIGVVDPEKGTVLGHLPIGWFPTRVALRDDQVYVTNAKGHGVGPNATLNGPLPRSFQADRRHGTISVFTMPTDLAKQTQQVFANNGFTVAAAQPASLPKEIRHVVLIVKENRTFDEVFGDIDGAPKLARWGRRVSPNHHAIAERWSMSNNFYADSEVSVDGHHWLVGSYPNVWTESTLMAAYGGQKHFRLTPDAPGRLVFAESNSSVHPEEQHEAGSIWHLLDRNGVTFRNFGEGYELAGVDEGEGLKPTGARYLTNVPMPDPLYRNSSRDYPNFNMNIPDQFRASQFIAEMDKLYVKPGKPLPRFIYIHLPNDHTARQRPRDGYPEPASFVSDNDYALGRILEHLSNLPAWRQMSVFITEDDAQGGVDHVDSHRTVMMLAGPYVKKGYVAHENSSFPGLLKTVFRLLGIPSLNLYDATATDLSDCFTKDADFAPYKLLPTDPAIFVPEHAKEPKDPRPGPKMDDPSELRRQHQQ